MLFVLSENLRESVKNKSGPTMYIYVVMCSHLFLMLSVVFDCLLELPEIAFPTVSIMKQQAWHTESTQETK